MTDCFSLTGTMLAAMLTVAAAPIPKAPTGWRHCWPRTTLAAEIRGEPASAAAIRAGPRLPPVPFVVLAATNHDMSPAPEARWRVVQARTAAESPKGRVVVVESGHYIQQDRRDNDQCDGPCIGQ
jgi:hypothetical protein